VGVFQETAKKSEIRNSKSEMGGPMLFPRDALPSGPQTCFGAEKGLLRVKVGKDFYPGPAKVDDFYIEKKP